MTATGLAVFDRTIQTTNIWLDELMREMHWEDRQTAYQGLRAVLHTLRDRLTIDEASDLAAQLPLMVRGIFYEGWHPANKPLKVRSRDEFLQQVADRFERDPMDVERLTRACFKVLGEHVTAGEIQDVRSSLPAPIRQLWPEPQSAAGQ